MFGILHPESTERDVVSFIGYGGGGNAAKEHCRRGASELHGSSPKVVQVLCGEHLEVQAAETIRLSTVGEDG
jgi:hypothetical protein